MSAFPTQICIVYSIWSLTGLCPAIRLPFYVLLYLGTITVVFFGRCSIAMLPQHVPWNCNRVPRLVQSECRDK